MKVRKKPLPITAEQLEEFRKRTGKNTFTVLPQKIKKGPITRRTALHLGDLMRQLGFGTYKDYLKSDRWRRIRQQVLAAAGNSCGGEKCEHLRLLNEWYKQIPPGFCQQNPWLTFDVAQQIPWKGAPQISFSEAADYYLLRTHLPLPDEMQSLFSTVYNPRTSASKVATTTLITTLNKLSEEFPNYRVGADFIDGLPLYDVRDLLQYQPIQVHHLAYDEDTLLGRRLDYVIAVCRRCHEDYHNADTDDSADMYEYDDDDDSYHPRWPHHSELPYLTADERRVITCQELIKFTAKCEKAIRSANANLGRPRLIK